MENLLEFMNSLTNKNVLFEDADVENQLNEDETIEDVNVEHMSSEDLKIEALKIATNIAKLMSGVTTDDIIAIASKVSDFIRNHQIGEGE